MSKSSSRMSSGQRRKRGVKSAIKVKGGAVHGEQQSQSQAARPKPSSLFQASDFTRDVSFEKAQGWKSAIQRYVSLYNQAETEQHARVLTDFVADQIHADRLIHRLNRIRERDLLRGALPAGSETKAELIRVNESSNEVSVLLRLHIKRKMEQAGRLYMEERFEYERLWLSSADSKWDVLQIEPIISERRPRYGTAVHQWSAESEAASSDDVYLTQSIPYLNYDLMPQFKNRNTGIRFRRDLAAAYADRWWNEGNPAYELFEVNCTNYVSQCIFAGNAPMNYTGKRGSGWWYKGRTNGQEWWSYSWAVSNALNHYLSTARKSGLQAVTVQSAEELQLGDVITYDWNGDGRFEHSTIVTAFDSAGQPLVNANTVASRHRYWDYQDSYAWTKGTRYRFFHIPDVL